MFLCFDRGIKFSKPYWDKHSKRLRLIELSIVTSKKINERQWIGEQFEQAQGPGFNSNVSETYVQPESNHLIGANL